MSTSIRAATDTLVHLLEQAIDADPDLGPLFALSGGTLMVTRITPEEMRDQGRQGLSVWLYLAERDDQRLNAPPQRLSRDVERPPPLPIRLHYLVAPVVALNAADVDASAQREQEILGVALSALHDHPVLAGSDLRHTLAGSPTQLTVRLEPLPLEAITRVWSSLRMSYQLCVSYEVSIVPVQSSRAAERIHPVRVTIPTYGVEVQEGS